MAKIVYGVSGEGSGHSSRAREILRYLLAQGHEVRVVSYDRGYRNLKDDFDVTEVAGLKIVSKNNKVSPLITLLENLRSVPDGIKSFRRVRKTLFKQFAPDCVITDFEPTTAYLANYYGLPLITIDNQHRMRYMTYEFEEQHRKDAIVTEAIIRAMVPRPTVSLITSFHEGELRNNTSYVFPPILRSEVLALKPEPGANILVYVTSGYESLLSTLAGFTREQFVVYGYNKGERHGNLLYKSFSSDGFLEDLRRAKAVVATAGFTLMTESLYLGVPMFALPMKGQFEQILNASMLDKLGYGATGDGTRDLAAFLYQLPDYRVALSSYPRLGNEQITTFLGKLLQDDCRYLREIYTQPDLAVQ
ncbi:MAG: hypothetical protein OEZ43_11010 [Gammaproteobacteria bacterium]|nr:hypothetical protein [Gammaproteobacteria bacterium]